MLLTETETSFARPVVRGARELCGPGNMMCGFQNVVERQRTRLSLSLSLPLRWALLFRRRRLTCSRTLEMTNDLLKSQHERMDKAAGVQTSLSRSKCLRRWRLTRQASATRPSQITLPSNAKILTPVGFATPARARCALIRSTFKEGGSQGCPPLIASLHKRLNVVNLYFSMFNSLKNRDITKHLRQSEQGRVRFSGTQGRLIPDFTR